MSAADDDHQVFTPLQGMASLGAGVIHAAAAGIHAEHPTLSRLFVAVAAAQIFVGLATLLRGGRAVAAATALVNGGAVVAWLVTRMSGISWIDGLEQSEGPQFADTVCAVLGALAVGAAVVTLRGQTRRTTRVQRRLPTPTATRSRPPSPTPTMQQASTSRFWSPTTRPDRSTCQASTASRPSSRRLPRTSSPSTSSACRSGLIRSSPEAAGFHSIGDGDGGAEHYVNWIDDDVWLDPDAPESLVYEPQPDGSKRLVSAMYMLPDDVALEDVPDYGGALMQWHIHDDLCFTADPVAPQLEDQTGPDGTCRPPLVKVGDWPMIHVRIVPHECGPFAALEGVGAGSIKDGEERWCDHAHGS